MLLLTGLSLVGIELAFFTALSVLLWFWFVTKVLVFTHWCCNRIAQSQDLLCLSLCPPQWGGWEWTQSEQLSWADQRVVPCHMASYALLKVLGRTFQVWMLFRDWLGTGLFLRGADWLPWYHCSSFWPSLHLLNCFNLNHLSSEFFSVLLCQFFPSPPSTFPKMDFGSHTFASFSVTASLFFCVWHAVKCQLCWEIITYNLKLWGGFLFFC